MNNRETLKRLLAQGLIDVRPSPLFETQPPPLPTGFDFDRIEGMMLGLAVGDSLGITTEAKTPTDRLARFGEIRDYLPNRHVRLQPGEPPRGYPSDDTQLAFWTLEQLLADQGFVPANVAARFGRGRIFGIGSAVRAFLFRLQGGAEWHRAGERSMNSHSRVAKNASHSPLS